MRFHVHRIIEECEQSKDMYEQMTTETAKNMGGINASKDNPATGPKNTFTGTQARTPQGSGWPSRATQRKARTSDGAACSLASGPEAPDSRWALQALRWR